MRYNLEDLSQLPIQDIHLYYCMGLGHEAAADPEQSLDDCPYGPSTETRIRCYRVAWRTAFRRARQIIDDRILAETFDRMCGNPIWRVAA